jgi:hypothetical protein
MSESNVTNVDIPAVQGVVNQLGTLSTSMGQLTSKIYNAGVDLSWTGADETGTALYDQLAPAEQGGISALMDTKQAVDGLIDSLGTTAGLWKNTEGTNIDLNH